MATNKRAVELLLDDMSKGTRGLLDGPNVHRADPRVAAFALSYLDAFGWLKDELAAWKDISLQDIKLAIGDLQKSLGLARTRTLTVQTVRAMEAPRCGCPDVLRKRHKCQKRFIRTARKATTSGRWRTDGLKWHVRETPAGLPAGAFKKAVGDAFDAWLCDTAVAIEESSARDADVIVGVDFGPQSNFDGPGGTLAWARMPQSDGEKMVIALDADERWTLDACDTGVCVHNVLRHEAGHLMGLTHNPKPCSLMSPFYNAAVDRPHQEDVKAFRALYL